MLETLERDFFFFFFRQRKKKEEKKEKRKAAVFVLRSRYMNVHEKKM